LGRKIFNENLTYTQEKRHFDIKGDTLKGLCNWFFFFIFRLKIVSREEKVEKKFENINESWRKPRNRAVWTADMRSTAHRAADLYYYFPAPSD
jgi:hypothetical protein